MSSSINPRPPHNNDSLSVNKPYRAVQIKFSRDTGHKSTGYEAQIDGIRGTPHGIRGTGFTGYGAHN